MRGRRGLASVAGLLAALAPGAAAGYPIAGGTLTLEERRTPAVLTRAGVDVRPVLLAPARDGVVRRVEGPADWLVLFQNPIRISSRARRIQVTDVRLRMRGVGPAMLLGRVRGVFMPIFELGRGGTTREYSALTGGYRLFAGFVTRLTPNAARALDRALQVRAFRAGQSFGTLRAGVTLFSAGGISAGAPSVTVGPAGEGASGRNTGVFGLPLIAGSLDDRGVGRVTVAGGLAVTYRTTQVRLADIVIDTRASPATVTTTLGGQETTLATFDLAAATVTAPGTLRGALTALTAEGAARLNALLGAGDLLAPGGSFIQLDVTAPPG